jgi:hypothetical protein
MPGILTLTAPRWLRLVKQNRESRLPGRCKVEELALHRVDLREIGCDVVVTAAFPCGQGKAAARVSLGCAFTAFEPSVPRRIFNGFEASSDLGPTDPRRRGSAEQLRSDQPIGSEGSHSRSRRSR